MRIYITGAILNYKEVKSNLMNSIPSGTYLYQLPSHSISVKEYTVEELSKMLKEKLAEIKHVETSGGRKFSLDL